MNTNPQSWTSRVLAAIFTLVVVAVGARLVWGFLEPLIGPLLVIGLLLGLISFIIHRRSGW